MPKMIGSSGFIENIWSVIHKVAETDATVLITGESGVGKELVADEIYTHSRRSTKPFIKLNCSSIPASLLESELFGYEKGAFTGANSNGKPGIFELADSGTLLLDEIGDMPIELQAKLLRVLQSKEIMRIGGGIMKPLDIRVIASTNQNLKKSIEDGKFRSDLFYRLSVVPIQVPSLRERSGDIPELCGYFLSKFTDKYKRSIQLSPENIKLLQVYDWPGNIRELENLMEYLVICFSEAEGIENIELKNILKPTGSNQSEYQSFSLKETMEAYEKEFIERVIGTARTMKEASELLDVDVSTISRKMKQYHIQIPSMNKLVK